LPVGFLPKIIRIGEVLAPIVVKELAKPRTQRLIREKRDELLQFALRKGKERLFKKGKSKTFIMRRNRQRFQCRKVN